MIGDEVAERLIPAFGRAAAYYAQRWGVDAQELEAQMYLHLCLHAEGARHACGPLLEQQPAYIATWAARACRTSVRRAWRRARVEVELCEEVVGAVGQDMGEAGTLAENIRALGAAWAVDTAEAAGIVEGEKETARLAEFGRVLGTLRAEERRIAAHLISGTAVYQLERRKLAPRRAASRVRARLVGALRGTA